MLHNKKNFNILSFLLIALIMVYLSVAASFQKIRPESAQAFTLIVEGKERNYIAYVPDVFADAQNAFPVVIVLHGGGGPMGNAQMMMDVSNWAQKAEKEKFLAVFPNGTLRDPGRPIELTGNIQEWSDGSGRSYAEQNGVDDVAFINTLIDDLLIKFPADKERIFVTGFSNGASMTFRVGVELADRIAAIASVAGVLSNSLDATNSPVSLLYISGSEDKRPSSLSPKNSFNINSREDKRPKIVTKNSFSSENPVALWAQMLACPSQPEVNLENKNIKTIIYSSCRGNTEVISYTVLSMGHVYPGAQTELWEEGADNPANDILNATDAVWDFFKKHKKSSAQSSARNVQCQTLSERNKKIQCWEKALNAELKESGLEASFVLFKELYDADQDFAGECHAFTHLIGTEAYNLFKNNKDFSVPAIVSFCNYGFYHGFMEALLTTGGNIEEARKFCTYIDRKLSVENPESPEQCYHGIGHGNAGVHDKRLFGNADAIIREGLKICKLVSDTKDRLYRCASGVYNAISDFHIEGEFGFSMDMIDPEDPLKICNGQLKEYQEPCYGNMKSVVSSVTGGDFKKVVAIISKIPDMRNAEVAMWYLAGYNMQTKLYLKDYYPDIAICRSALPNLYLPCIRGLATGFLWYAKPEEEYKSALNFCALDILRPEEKEACFSEIIPRLSFYYSYTKVIEICETKLVPDAWKGICRTKQLNQPVERF
ncbi:hypothetical protein A3A05_00600 [Candidatus Nomurabacteria bacterium RIFCSPLOWO2_01_FULL_41_12]|uniref:Phospholipase/carboxylesterase/thioesterase domain-containing protein n=1 Tax=Candidatus Nomurabacteria bacterium RIFCSPLOWO2_01_FULL_41_12 TaxID=1801774 RepID=A0A1F6WWI8_9BACT|nr:MAG: hypothetical protein A3A05_00600 [Candidatus Nomurabacteria bacterium RIFCSPLOWO2_01_FULL_41_12]